MCPPQVPSIRIPSKMAVFNNERLRRRRWTLGLGGVMCVLAVGVGIGLAESHRLAELNALAQRVHQCLKWASVIRLSVIALLCVTWSRLIRLSVASTNPAFERLVNARWRVTGWLLFIEIILGQNLLGRLVP